MALADYLNTHSPTQTAQDVLRSMFRAWVHAEYERAENGPSLDNTSASGLFKSSVLQDVLHALQGDYNDMPDDAVEELFTLYDMAGEDSNPEWRAEEFREWRSRNLSYSYHSGARTVRFFLQQVEALRQACQGSAAWRQLLQHLISCHLSN